MVIVGSAIGDNRATDVERGVIRAFDATAARWLGVRPAAGFSRPTRPRGAWDLAPGRRNAAAGNAWGVDVGGPGARPGVRAHRLGEPGFLRRQAPRDNRFANSLLALDARTGKLRWHQQLVHHDLWDYDLAAQPVLVDMERQRSAGAGGDPGDKTGMLFVFERTPAGRSSR